MPPLGWWSRVYIIEKTEQASRQHSSGSLVSSYLTSLHDGRPQSVRQNKPGPELLLLSVHCSSRKQTEKAICAQEAVSAHNEMFSPTAGEEKLVSSVCQEPGVICQPSLQASCRDGTLPNSWGHKPMKRQSAQHSHCQGVATMPPPQQLSGS